MATCCGRSRSLIQGNAPWPVLSWHQFAWAKYISISIACPGPSHAGMRSAQNHISTILCPLWVIRGHFAMQEPLADVRFKSRADTNVIQLVCPFFLRKRTFETRVDWPARSYFLSSSSTNSFPKIGTCPFMIFSIAESGANQPMRSASGKSLICPDFGGHSIENTLLLNVLTSKSLSTAQAVMTLPLRCLNDPSAMNSP